MLVGKVSFGNSSSIPVFSMLYSARYGLLSGATDRTSMRAVFFVSERYTDHRTAITARHFNLVRCFKIWVKPAIRIDAAIER